MDRTAFLAERKKGIGGSDIAAVFNEGYGCRCRLWRDKRDEVPDFPHEENLAMELGAFLEPFFAERYKKITGRNVVVMRDPIVHDTYHWLRVNVDRMVNRNCDDADKDFRETGVLEIKSVGREIFYRVKREGLPVDYIMQLQHGMLVTDSKWGSYAIGNRESGELLWWDVERDERLCQTIIVESAAFWREVLDGMMPERLDPDDKRCQRCEYRLSCQGNALVQLGPFEGKQELEPDETLRPLVNELLERKVLLQQAESLVAETSEELKTAIGDRTALAVGGHKVYFRPQVAMRWNAKVLAVVYTEMRNFLVDLLKMNAVLTESKVKEYPEAEKFKEPGQSRPLRIY